MIQLIKVLQKIVFKKLFLPEIEPGSQSTKIPHRKPPTNRATMACDYGIKIKIIVLQVSQ